MIKLQFLRKQVNYHAAEDRVVFWRDFITRYKQGYISFEEFMKRIQYIEGITFQYAFCTQRAIGKLLKQTSR